jgi:hypothetical protein
MKILKNHAKEAAMFFTLVPTNVVGEPTVT